jgi:hypothetical protein
VSCRGRDSLSLGNVSSSSRLQFLRGVGFNPWERADYFGRSLDLGQFERFRRIVYTPSFVTLVNHTHHRVCSTLEVSDDVWVARVLVGNEYRKEEHVYEVKAYGGGMLMPCEMKGRAQPLKVWLPSLTHLHPCPCSLQ